MKKQSSRAWKTRENYSEYYSDKHMGAHAQPYVYIYIWSSRTIYAIAAIITNLGLSSIRFSHRTADNNRVSQSSTYIHTQTFPRELSRFIHISIIPTKRIYRLYRELSFRAAAICRSVQPHPAMRSQ